MRKYCLETFGCAMNQADSEKIKLIMLEAGFILAKNFLDADLVLINTCSVRQKGEDKVFGLVEEIVRENKRRQTLSLTHNTPHPNPLQFGEGEMNIELTKTDFQTPGYVYELARNLRKTGTDVEKIMWEILRNKKVYGYKFRRQHPIGRYIADFYSSQLRLVIELDGKIHENQKEYDEIRDEVISKYGINILRLANDQITNNLENTIKKITSFIPPLGIGEGVRGGGVSGGGVREGNLKTLIKIGLTGCMVRKTGINEKYHKNKERDRNKSKKIILTKFEEDILNHDDKLFPKSKGKLDFVFRIEDIKYIPFILSTIYGEKIGNEYKYDNYLKAKALRDNPASVPIIIQTGCDNYCSYCIVPYSRGIEKSRPQEEIIEEVKEAVKAGAKEITLTGQNVNSYGKQFLDKKYWNEEKGKWNEGVGKSPFRQLLEELDKIEGLDRIRFTSSNPHDMTQDILDAHFELNKTCNDLHFALQSGNNEILKKMNRKHTYDDFKKMVEYLRSKDPYFSVSTDIICGFSGETEEMFEDTLKAFDELEFDFSYNARYSVRTGTLAAKIYKDDISNEVKASRWHKLNNKLLETITKRNKMMIGKIEEVLVAGQKNNYYYGRTRNYKEVFFTGDSLKIGDIVKVKINELNRYVLKGIVI